MRIVCGMAIFLFCLPLQAVPIQWDIRFTDDYNRLVGSGWFAYDPDIETPIHAGFGDDKTLQFTVSSALTDLDWTVQGQHWTLADASTLWWRDDTGEPHPPGYLGRSRGPEFVDENRWFIGDPFLGSKQFLMSFEHADSASGEGSWGQQVAPGYGPGPGPLFGSGSWRATPRPAIVPVPNTLPLFLLGLAGLGWWRLRRRW